MRGQVVTVGLVGAVLAAAAPAGAQSPSYGGGYLPAASPPRGYSPTMAIVLQPRGGAMALHFDTTLLCDDDVYSVVGRASVPFDGRSFAAKAARQFRIGTHRGNRVVFSWTLRGQVDGTIGSGRLRITGRRYIDGHRVSCRHKPGRRFAARVEGPVAPGSPKPPPRAAFGGLSEIRVAQGLRAPVVLKVSRSAKKLAAEWTAFAGCRKGRRADLVNLTPAMRIRRDGSFSRSERFSQSFSDAFIRYRVRFAGRISGELANGTLRMRARIYSADGRRLRTRCDSRARRWSARMIHPIAPAPPGTGSPAPQPTTTPGQQRVPVAGAWSLHMTSDSGDYIGQGRTWSHGPPGDRALVRVGTPQYVDFHIDTADQSDGGWWDTEFAAGPGDRLEAGRTYSATRYPFNDNGPGFEHSGMGRGCNELKATFTVREIAFDADGTLRRFLADFEQHCEGGEAALRGTWDFRAA
jgi:hypothetical protein